LEGGEDIDGEICNLRLAQLDSSKSLQLDEL
jgi:hypothetical protein